MLGFLFRGLTADPQRGAALFAAIIAETRQPHWYVEGKVPDTIDGRFAVLATLTALAAARIEQAGDEGNLVSVALTERFIEVMESEHRELGIGDPTLGKKVRKLVGSLSRRVELWRRTTAGEGDWNESAHQSLYNGGASAGAILHSTEALRRYWARLERIELQALAEGRLG
jgi:cytochrome b pre-mRNA-processing protein 3